MAIAPVKFIYKLMLSDTVKNYLSGNGKALTLDESELNEKVERIYEISNPKKNYKNSIKSAIKSDIIEFIGRDTAADVKQNLFVGISPEYQRLIFDLFDQGSGLNLKENMERFLAFRVEKPMPDFLAETNTIFDTFHTRITEEDMQQKLKILERVEREAPDLLKVFTKDEWNLIHSINHIH